MRLDIERGNFYDGDVRSSSRMALEARLYGRVAEWPNASVLKTEGLARAPWVRILPLPFFFLSLMPFRLPANTQTY